jgi:sporulation protein YlmC with PRC-barrel domain
MNQEQSMKPATNLRHSKIARAIGFAFVIGMAGSGHVQADNAAQPAIATPSSQGNVQDRGRTQATAPHSTPASRILGMDVENRQGEHLGEIIDLMIDAGDELVEFAILSFGGVMNLGDKLFAYPLDRFDRVTARDPDKLVLNVAKERLESAPGFDRSLWPDFDRSEYRRQIEAYYGRLPDSSQGRYLRASQMLAGDVKQTNGNDIGDVHDFAIDLDDGRVHFVVVEFEDGWAGRGDLVAVPMRGFRSEDRDGTDLVFTATRQELRNAPTFEHDTWPSVVNNAEFNSDIDRYHRSWSSAGARLPGRRT